jgi:hypothetical protein
MTMQWPSSPNIPEAMAILRPLCARWIHQVRGLSEVMLRILALDDVAALEILLAEFPDLAKIEPPSLEEIAATPITWEALIAVLRRETARFDRRQRLLVDALDRLELGPPG